MTLPAAREVHAMKHVRLHLVLAFSTSATSKTSSFANVTHPTRNSRRWVFFRIVGSEIELSTNDEESVWEQTFVHVDPVYGWNTSGSRWRRVISTTTIRFRAG